VTKGSSYEANHGPDEARHFATPDPAASQPVAPGPMPPEPVVTVWRPRAAPGHTDDTAHGIRLAESRVVGAQSAPNRVGAQS